MTTVTESRPKDLRQTIDAILAVLRQFRTVLEAHTKALQERDEPMRQALEDKKKQAADHYIDTVKQMRRLRADVQLLPAEIKEKIRSEQAALTKALDDNHIALLKAKTVAERMGEIIISAARRSAASTATNYTASAATQGGSGKAQAVTLNESL